MSEIVAKARAYLAAQDDACSNERCIGYEARDMIMELAAEVERLRAENEVLRIQRDAAIDETYTTNAECWRLREQLAALRKADA